MGEGPRLGLVVFLAMVGNLMVAGFAGAFIPILLERSGVDPAVASSIFVTTFTDVCGFLLLLGLAGMLLLLKIAAPGEWGGTLLQEESAGQDERSRVRRLSLSWPVTGSLFAF
jgi:hypothetical protein